MRTFKTQGRIELMFFSFGPSFHADCIRPISIESPWDFELSFVSHPFPRHMIHRYTMANGAVWHILLGTLWGVPGPWTLCSHGRWPRACCGEVPPPPRRSMATWQRWQCPIALGEWRSGPLAADMDIIWKVSKSEAERKKTEKHRHKSLFKVERSFFGVFVLQLLLASNKKDTKMVSNFPGNLSSAAFRLTFCLMPARQLQESGVVFDKNAPPTYNINECRIY